MFDLLSGLNYDSIFSGGALVVSTIILFIMRNIAKKTENTIDDKVVEAFEAWYAKYKESLPRSNKK